MTPQIAFMFAVLAAMIWLFMSERLPVDLTAFLGLAVLTVGGLIEPGQAFQGFSSPAVITLLSIFIVAAAINQSGVADVVGRRVHAWVGSAEVALMAAVMVLCIAISAWMNNVAATALLMPAVSSIARRSGLAPARLFMPLAFASILGGTLTLIGTPPNILAAQMLEEAGLRPFSMFQFTPLGVAVAGLGMLFVLTVGRRLLPARSAGPAPDPRADLTQVYRLKERLFSIRVPESSPLAGITLREAQLSTALDIHVVEILRGGRKQLAPGNDAVIQGGDVLVVAGRFEDLQQRLRMRGVVVEKSAPSELGEVSGYYDLVLVRLREDSPEVGQRLGDVPFREQFGVVAAGVWRGGQILRDDLPRLRLNPGDEVLLVGVQHAVDQVMDHPDFEVVSTGPRAVERLRQSLFLVRIPEGSELEKEATTPRSVEETIGAPVVAVVRFDETIWAASPDEPLRAGDRLLVAGAPTRILSLTQVGELQLERNVAQTELESEHVGVVEAVVAPRSQIAGKTLVELRFREKYGMQVLAIWREGKALRAGIAETPIKFGDALLLHGTHEKARLLARDPDFLVLTSEKPVAPPRKGKAPFAVGALLLMVGLELLGVYPVQVAAFLAAVVVLLSRSLTMEEAYRAVEWRVIFQLSALLPIGVAMQKSGAAGLLADTVVGAAGPYGPYAVLCALLVLTSAMSQCFDGGPTVVLLAPVAMLAADRLHISPYPMVMGVGLAGSATFLTPFSHKANLLVMAAGGYRVKDYVRLGGPLTLLMLVILAVLVPVLFPFDPTG